MLAKVDTVIREMLGSHETLATRATLATLARISAEAGI
jgi:hypothetical protein